MTFRPDPKPLKKTVVKRAKTILKIRAKRTGESRSYIEGLLDSKFSIWIRRRWANHDGSVQCFTCIQYLHWKQAHCGHYVSRSHRSTRWHDVNCQVQCPKCNINLRGNLDVFKAKLDNMYGKGTADELTALGKEEAHFTQSELKEMLEQLRLDIANL